MQPLLIMEVIKQGMSAPLYFDFNYCQTIINRCLANDFWDLP